MKVQVPDDLNNASFSTKQHINSVPSYFDEQKDSVEIIDQENKIEESKEITIPEEELKCENVIHLKNENILNIDDIDQESDEVVQNNDEVENSYDLERFQIIQALKKSLASNTSRIRSHVKKNDNSNSPGNVNDIDDEVIDIDVGNENSDHEEKVEVIQMVENEDPITGTLESSSKPVTPNVEQDEQNVEKESDDESKFTIVKPIIELPKDNRTYLVLDTNIWIKELEWIKSTFEDPKYSDYLIFVPLKVFQEIKGLEFSDDEDVVKAAKSAFKIIYKLMKFKKNAKISFQNYKQAAEASQLFPNQDKPDLIIIQAALHLKENGKNVKIFTRDKTMEIDAKALDIDIFEPDLDEEEKDITNG